jgi:hypothetical protein
LFLALDLRADCGAGDILLSQFVAGERSDDLAA